MRKLKAEERKAPRRQPAAATDPEEHEADDELVRRLAQRLGYVFVRDLSEYPVDPVAREVIPTNVIKRHCAVPVGFEGEALVVAVADPTNVVALDDLRMISGRELKVLVARQPEIEEVISRLDHLDTTAQTLLEEAAGTEDLDESEDDIGPEEAPIVKAINRIITTAVQQRASDIHIEPQQGEVRIRFRIDGVLNEAMTTRRSLHLGMISRLKVMADLNIAEKRVPQDGRISIKVENRPVDLRVASLPTSWGEKIVLRILDHSTGVLSLEDLGFDEHALSRYREAASRPHGAVLITGPTGSGKSTTLYATLQEINSPTRNIVTVEDPVEVRIPGISQMQVHTKAGLTFATALRSILRADPDVLMVGEMRDYETATIGIQAALTGHLVFATLHTNDASSAVTRLTEMGVEPFLVASAVECVVAQRLGRKLCAKCAETYRPPSEVLESDGFPWSPGDPIPLLRRPVGCNTCAGTGYRGRLAIIEVLRVTEDIRRLTVERRSADEIKRQAVADGMRTLREDGLRKALDGQTSVEEVLRVVV